MPAGTSAALAPLGEEVAEHARGGDHARLDAAHERRIGPKCSGAIEGPEEEILCSKVEVTLMEVRVSADLILERLS